MWYRYFKDYPPDTPLIQDQVSPSHGIIGCEMHELNGWGMEFEDLHLPIKPSKYNKSQEDKR